MRHLFSLAFAAAIMAVSPYPSFATQVADADASAYCGPDAPASYKRPGGFCDQLDNNKSLVTEPEGCPTYIVGMLTEVFGDDGRIHVATPYYDPCCRTYSELSRGQLTGDRTLVADSGCYAPRP